MQEAKSFCRQCSAGCGMIVTLDDDGRIASLKADREAPLSRGYACFKGLRAGDGHNSPDRLLRPLKRMPDGSFAEIALETALDEIAAKIAEVVDRHGPDSVATWTGGAQMMSASALMMGEPFRKALGTASHFSNITIDQSSKLVTADRLGSWGAGKQPIENGDVHMLIGTNPLVAHATVGSLMNDPVKRMKALKARGLKLIVIDPRQTETAQFADIFIQPYPGEDPTLLAGMLRIIMANDWFDRDFCAAWVKPGALDILRQAVEPFTDDYVAKRCGIRPGEVEAAARMFAHESRAGSAFCATGTAMAPRGNLTDHLIECINVVCGRFRREGDLVREIGAWLPPRPYMAQVYPPQRGWEQEPSRIRGAKTLLMDERTSCTLSDEILTPGEGQIRVLLNDGGNPAATLPDQVKTARAFADLDLLVTVDPYMTSTARLSHYVLPPRMMYERPDLPLSLMNLSFNYLPWAQYSGPVATAPDGSELMDDWELFWGVAVRLGLQLEIAGSPLDMGRKPTTDELLELLCTGSRVPLEEIKKHSSGKVFDIDVIVEAPAEPSEARFDIMPDDIRAELATVAAEKFLPDGQVHDNGQVYPFRLASRRMRDLVNSGGLANPGVRKRNPFNPVWMNPADMAASGLDHGDAVSVSSDHGTIPGIVASDETIRQGVIMMSHAWGGLPTDAPDYMRNGSNTNLLISVDRAYEPINSMVRMSAIPVNVMRANFAP